MLRVGLTGELGSGKSTVARLLAERGAIVLSSDEMGRALMQPGEGVFARIVEAFGPEVLTPEGSLNRPKLAELAFHPTQPRVEELNGIVHPAVLAAQEQRIAALARVQPEAIVVVESALIFSTRHAGGEPWRKRFDLVVLVTAAEGVKMERVLARIAKGRALSDAERTALTLDAQRRLAAQRIPAEAARQCLLLANDGGMEELQARVEDLWQRLLAANFRISKLKTL